MSFNHQFVQHAGTIVRKYTKTTNRAITGFRLDPSRLENRIDWLLASPESAFDVTWNDGEEVKLVRKSFTYEDEVLELYSDAEVRAFERWNAGLLARGILKEYDGSVPEIDTTNFMTDGQISEIAAIKNINALRKKLATITSVETINRILTAAEQLDRSYSMIKAIQERKKELQ